MMVASVSSVPISYCLYTRADFNWLGVTLVNTVQSSQGLGPLTYHKDNCLIAPLIMPPLRLQRDSFQNHSVVMSYICKQDRIELFLSITI